MPTPFTPVQDQIFAYFPIGTHPAHRLNDAILELLTAESVVLDIGCGRTAPTLIQWVGVAKKLHGVDIVPFDIERSDISLHNCSVTDMDEIPDSSIDLAYSRAVMEHLSEPGPALQEIHRVLKPSGRYIFITPSVYDYASIAAAVVPNAWHPTLVHLLTGRNEADVFPTHFRANSRRKIEALSDQNGYDIEFFYYIGQYPAYLQFNRALFWLGSIYEKFLERHRSLHFLRGWIFCSLQKRMESNPGVS